jgi:hypothetical protein
MNYYKVLDTSYINGAIRQAGDVVRINDDPAKGGMRPGKFLVPCDAEGNEVARKRGKQPDTNATDIG